MTTTPDSRIRADWTLPADTAAPPPTVAPDTSTTHVSHTEDVLGEWGFRLVWDVSGYVANVVAYCLSEIDEDNHDPNYLAGCESYLSGFVRRDGCTELDMGCPHWCGPAQYVLHGELLKHIYHRAFELMGRTPDEAWPA